MTLRPAHRRSRNPSGASDDARAAGAPLRLDPDAPGEPSAGAESPEDGEFSSVGAPFSSGGTSLDETWPGRVVTTEGIFVTDDRQRVRTWSAGAQRMLGYAPEEVVGRLCYDVMMGMRPDGHPVCGTNCPVTRNARRGRGTASYQITAVARDGASRYFDNTVLVLEGPRNSFRIVHLLRESCETPPVRPAPTPPTAEEMRLAELLTRRELEVLRLFAHGATLTDAAAQLSISVFTARNHATNIQHKLGVRNRLQMVLEGMRRGLV